MIAFPALLLLIVSSFGLGRLCLWRARFARPAEEFVFSSALGTAVLSYSALLLGAIARMSESAVVLIFFAGCLIAAPIFARFVVKLRRRLPRLGLLPTVCLVVLAAAIAVNVVIATNPSLEVDAYEYHITVPKAWLVAGRIFPIPYCLQSNYHLLADMINVVALSLSPNDVVLCKLIQCYSGVLLAVAAWCFGRSFFSPRVAWVAATLTYLVREIAWISTNGYVDLTIGLYVWLGIFAMIRAAHLRGLGWHLLAGLFLGCGVASKQNVALFAAIAYLAYAVVLAIERRRRSQLRIWPGRTAVAAAIALLIASPWMIKNHSYTGDPFYPFLVESFNVPHEFAQASQGFTGYYGGLKNYVIWNDETLPRLVRTFHNFRNNILYTGANVLVVWLLISVLLLYLLRCSSSFVLRLLIALGALGAPWFALVESRFLFGFFPIYLLVLIQTIRLAARQRRFLFTLLALVLLSLYARTFVRYEFREELRWGFVPTLGPSRRPCFSAKARKEWLMRYNYAYPVIARVNHTLGRGDRLLACAGIQAMPWLDVPFVPNPHWMSETLLAVLWGRFRNTDALLDWLQKQRITHVLLEDNDAQELDQRSGFIRSHLELVFGDASLSLYRIRKGNSSAPPKSGEGSSAKG
ncbi:glycosyltransferase family 39 protein [Candidatus Sumerlaeota bacterium]|nr:glycosyltransferase family 39 protein [Candidatus Sumerlaeota bacterium]